MVWVLRIHMINRFMFPTFCRVSLLFQHFLTFFTYVSVLCKEIFCISVHSVLCPYYHQILGVTVYKLISCPRSCIFMRLLQCSEPRTFVKATAAKAALLLVVFCVSFAIQRSGLICSHPLSDCYV